jgi:hypothetical protein
MVLDMRTAQHPDFGGRGRIGNGRPGADKNEENGAPSSDTIEKMLSWEIHLGRPLEVATGMFNH